MQRCAEAEDKTPFPGATANMGCTSSNPKRTTSADDLTKEPLASNKNGQLGSQAPPEKAVMMRNQEISNPPGNDTSKQLQIPGTHKSFLAPDGIPFIDEDIEDSEAEDQLPKQHLSNTTSDPPDQNKNTISCKPKETTVVESRSPNSALVGNEKLSEHTEASSLVVESHSGSKSGQPSVVSEIKIQEVQQTSIQKSSTGNLS